MFVNCLAVLEIVFGLRIKSFQNAKEKHIVLRDIKEKQEKKIKI